MVIVADGMIAFLPFSVHEQHGTGSPPDTAAASSHGAGRISATGYRAGGAECVAIDIAESSSAAGRAYGSGWPSLRGYKDPEGTSCEAIPVREHAFLRSVGYEWPCDRGRRQDRETCVPIDVPANAHLDRSGNAWRCDRGFQLSDEGCVLGR